MRPPQRVLQTGTAARVGQQVAIHGNHDHIRRAGVAGGGEVVGAQLPRAGCVVSGLFPLAQRLEVVLQVVRCEAAQIVL